MLLKSSPISQITLDVSGLRCPMPLLKTKQKLSQMESGQRLFVLATDPGSMNDIPKFAQQVGHKMIACEKVGTVYHFHIEKK